MGSEEFCIITHFQTGKQKALGIGTKRESRRTGLEELYIVGNLPFVQFKYTVEYQVFILVHRNIITYYKKCVR